MRNFHDIHPTALIGDNVHIGKNVTVGARAIIYDNVTIGDSTVIGANCILGEPQAGIYKDLSGYQNPELSLGANSLIRSGTIIYAGTEIGESFECGHRVTIREKAKIGQPVSGYPGMPTKRMREFVDLRKRSAFPNLTPSCYVPIQVRIY